MTITHLSYSQIPSRKANAVQVMQFCEAFARLGHEVTLYAAVGSEPVEDAYAYYGVAPCFEVVRHRRTGQLKELQYSWAVGRAVRQRPLPDLFYARDLYSLAMVASLGRPLVFEAHMLPT